MHAPPSHPLSRRTLLTAIAATALGLVPKTLRAQPTPLSEKIPGSPTIIVRQPTEEALRAAVTACPPRGEVYCPEFPGTVIEITRPIEVDKPIHFRCNTWLRCRQPMGIHVSASHVTVNTRRIL